MGHHKLQRFAENLTFPNLFQVGFDQLEKEGFALRGRWREQFGNDNPITLELGCGKGDYTIALARIHPERNYIGVDIKGARLWRGAKTSNEEQMKNVAFIRTRIELIDRFFAEGEVSEIWITFCDPQLKKPNKRLTSPRFLDTYRRFLAPGSIMHLKTDSQELYDYTLNEVLPDTRRRGSLQHQRPLPHRLRRRGQAHADFLREDVPRTGHADYLYSMENQLKTI